MHGDVFVGVLFPEDVAIQIQSCGSQMAEVHVEASAAHEGRGAGRGVFAVHFFGFADVRLEHFPVPEQFAACLVQTQCVESGGIPVAKDGTGEKNFAPN